MPKIELERKLSELASRFSQLSMQQREIAIKLAEVTEELARRLSGTRRTRETPSECAKGNRIVITNSRNRSKRKATITRVEEDRACFRFNSEHFAWRLKCNARPI